MVNNLLLGALHYSRARPASKSYFGQAAPMWVNISDRWSVFWPLSALASGFRLGPGVAGHLCSMTLTDARSVLLLTMGTLPYSVMMECCCKGDVSIGVQEHSPTLRPLNHLQFRLFRIVFLIESSGITLMLASKLGSI